MARKKTELEFERKELFLERFSQTLDKTNSIKGIGSVKNLFYWLDNDPDFAAKVINMERAVIHKAEDTLLRLLDSADEKIRLKAAITVLNSRMGKKYTQLAQASIDNNHGQLNEIQPIEVEYIVSI